MTTLQFLAKAARAFELIRRDLAPERFKFERRDNYPGTGGGAHG
jgi:hypothetical protein